MKKYIVILASMLIAVTGCDILNTTPESTLNKDSFFQTETDLQLFSNAFYDQFDDDAKFYQAQSDHFINLNLSNELRGGNTRNVPSTGGGWSFTMLRRINNLLENIDKCKDDAVRAQYTALAKFFRAYFYFEKVKRFGDVPFIDRPLEDNDEALYGARDTREYVFHKILEDVDEAIAVLPSAKSLYRVNKYAALAFKAQACLYEGTYRTYHANNTSTNNPWSTEYETADQLLGLAAAAAKEVMDGPYKLKNDYLMLFAEPDADTDEMILAMRFEPVIGRKNNTTAFATMPSQGCPGLTKKFVDSFLMKDGSRFTDKEGWETMTFMDEVADRDPRLAYITRIPGYTRIGAPTTVLASDYSSSVTGFQLVKFVMDATLDAVDRVDMSYNDLPIYRLGEIYLIYAEAKAELGDLSQDDLNISVNKLRARVGMPAMDLVDAKANPDSYLLGGTYGYSSPVLAANPNVGVILEIRRERAIELAQEGRRWDDLMRWAEGKCIDQPMYGPYFPGEGKYDITGDGVADLYFYTGTKPSEKNIQLLELGVKTGVILSEGDHGYVDNQKGIEHSFNESRDYLYPIPTQERLLNRNLTQNPGWDDGISEKDDEE